MISRIKAIVFDMDAKSHDYSGIRSEQFHDAAETGFDFVVRDGDCDPLRVLSENRGFDCIITVGDGPYMERLSDLPFRTRMKWVHFDVFEPDRMSDTILNVFTSNIGRQAPHGFEMFSFFTCTFNTGREKLLRLYRSMLAQTYRDWEWVVLDDSTDGETVDILNGLGDPRIIVYRNSSDHGAIGFNKRSAAMLCNGDYLVEVDHDDELTPDCLQCLWDAFETYPDVDFVYSDTLEDIGGQSVVYPEGWGWNEGTSRQEKVGLRDVTISVSPGINPFSIRTIYAQPNHVRCWKSSFYHRIGGHNPGLGVLDDMDLIIRTFLEGSMAKVDKVLYIQYEGEGERGNGGSSTQSVRFAEIQRTCHLLKVRYDKQIHDRILQLGYNDIAWDEQQGCSVLWAPHERGLEIMSRTYSPGRD